MGRKITSIAIFLILIFVSCKHETIDQENIRTVYFDKEVLPIFQTNCAISGCHDGSGELDLSNYESISKNLKKGDPDGSRIYEAITSVWGESMPPDKPLSQDQRTLIRLWILQGAQDNKAPLIAKPIDTTQNNIDTTVIIPNDSVDKISYKVCFSRDILPVLLANCATTGCHNSTSGQEGIIISDYSSVMSLVSARNPGSSKLYQVITTTDPENRMPPSSQLPSEAIDSIRRWITLGALNETCPDKCDTSVYTYSGAVKPLIDLKCKSCHNASNASKGIRLDDYSYVANIATSGVFMNVLKATNGYKQMPPSGALDACTIIAIQKWIRADSKNN